MSDYQTVRTRMAPSPTGSIHVGSMAILLKNYAFARKNHGQFILRIEDTDQEREVPGAVEEILQVIKDYGLDWDEGPDKEGSFGPYTQSKRLDLYRKKALELVEQKKAYYCFCSKERLEKVRAEQMLAKKPPKYDGHCRHLSPEEVDQRLAANEDYVIRLKVPDNQEVIFNDLIRGEIKFNSKDVDDQVLLKSDGFPTYHLAVVVDDHAMKISHVLRGEEWISSTPKHILLYQAFGWQCPVFAHIPIFLNPDGRGKMSKRKGTVSAQSFLDQGYLPEALLNFFMILGWAKKDQEEIMTLDEYIQEFDPKDISAKSVVFDLKKLAWINGVYIRKISLALLAEKVQKFLPADFPKEKLSSILPLVAERLEKLSDMEELTSFFYKDITIEESLLLKKGDQQLVKNQLELTIQKIENLEAWQAEILEPAIRSLQEQENYNKKQYFMMLRAAVTGKAATPPLFETIEVIGQEKTLNRLKKAITIVSP